MRFQLGSIFGHLVPQTSGIHLLYWRSPAVPEECRPVSAIPHSQYKPGPVRQLVFQDWGLRFWLAGQINLQKKLATGNWAAKAGGTAKKYDWIWQAFYAKKQKREGKLFLQAYFPLKKVQCWSGLWKRYWRTRLDCEGSISIDQTHIFQGRYSLPWNDPLTIKTIIIFYFFIILMHLDYQVLLT